MAQSMPQQLNKKSTSSHQLSDSYPLPLHMMQITSCLSSVVSDASYFIHTITFNYCPLVHFASVSIIFEWSFMIRLAAKPDACCLLEPVLKNEKSLWTQ